MKRALLICVCLATGLICASKSFATPALGVATDTKFYAGDSEDWLNYDYFDDVTVVPMMEEYEGFLMGQSGSYLTIFTSYVPGNKDIYLMTNANQENAWNLSFNDTDFFPITSDKQIDGYKKAGSDYDYYSTKLPESGWDTVQFDKEFYLLTGQLNYSGNFVPGEYFFAATGEMGGYVSADTDSSDFTLDNFSPKTTSAGGHPVVPEPATVLILGIGLAGIGVFKSAKI